VISATIDSSVYIRALHLGGPAALLIGHARAGNIRIDISDPILNETMRVLRDKFEWSGDMLHDARGKLAKLTNRVMPVETVSVIREDPDDNRILECADAARVRFHRQRGQGLAAARAIWERPDSFHKRVRTVGAHSR
jgi:predicted nucleic acid-binding protein